MTDSVSEHTGKSFFNNFGFTQNILTIFPKAIPYSKKNPSLQDPLTSSYSTSDDEVLSETGTSLQDFPKSDQLDSIFATLTESKDVSINNTVIKAYKSKLKTKFQSIYENNSKTYIEKTKFKLYHKCCHPHCGRTFSSAGWLKAHYDEHLKELKYKQFNVLFEKFVNNI